MLRKNKHKTMGEGKTMAKSMMDQDMLKVLYRE